MGKLKAFEINIQGGDHQMYYSGTRVEGNVTIQLSQSKMINQIRIVLSGQASTKLSPSGPNVDLVSRLLPVSDCEYIFSDMIIQLVHAGDLHTEIPAGQHQYPFMFHLPSNIPSSFESIHGNIRYTLTATLSRPNKSIDHCRIKRIKVHDLIDSSTPELIEHCSASTEGFASYLFPNSCFVQLSATIERGGYCPGDSFTITVNHTHRIISSISALLRQRIRYNAGSRNCKSISNIISRIDNSSFRAESGSSIKTANMFIPFTVTPSINNCHILDVSYELFILQNFKVPGFQNKSLSIPLVIGNAQHSQMQPALSNVDNLASNNDTLLESVTINHTISETPPPPYSEILTDSYPSIYSPS